MSWSIEKKVVGGLGLALAIMVILSLASYYTITRLAEDNGWVAHTHDMLAELEMTSSTIKDVETGSRGYLITGNKQFLEPYYHAIDKISGHLQRLKVLTEDNPNHQRRLPELEREIANKLQFQQELIDVQREQGTAAAQLLMSTSEGRRQMASIQAIIAEMKYEEAGLLKRRTAQSQASGHNTLLTFATLVSLNGGLLFLIYFLIKRDITERKRAEEELRRAHDELEQRVAGRTNELAEANTALQVEIAVRRQAEQEREQLLAREQNARALAEASEYKYRFLAETIPQIIWTAEPDGWRDYYNRRWFDYTGMTPEETQGWGWQSALHPDDLRHSVEVWRRSVGTGEPYEIEHRFRRAADGAYRWHLVRALPMRDHHGRVVKWFGTCTDVDDQKRAAEQMLRFNEELERQIAERTAELRRSNAELEQFAYVASHDLQEPLRMVASYTQLLARRYRNQLDASADEFINFAVDGANRMQRLINDLLAYSRVGTRGKEFAPVDCQAVLQRTLGDLRLAIAEGGAEVTLGELPAVVGDEGQLGQLFQNLVGNALKFRNGRVPVVRVWAEPRGGEWIFAVQDNGIGIESQYAERIFVIFQRLHTREEYSGTGIGLAICKKIVERHGGRIWVESVPGQGATFYFTLPGAKGGAPGAAGPR